MARFEREDRQRSGAEGFDKHLVKPIQLEALRELIERFYPSSWNATIKIQPARR
jgi:CheY-like chemotaxis protein